MLSIILFSSLVAWSSVESAWHFLGIRKYMQKHTNRNGKWRKTNKLCVWPFSSSRAGHININILNRPLYGENRVFAVAPVFYRSFFHQYTRFDSREFFHSRKSYVSRKYGECKFGARHTSQDYVEIWRFNEILFWEVFFSCVCIFDVIKKIISQFEVSFFIKEVLFSLYWGINET